MMTGTYERIANQMLAGQKTKPRAYCVFNPEMKRLMVGTQSLHLTPVARQWRLFWRLKYNRAHHE